MTYTDNPKAGTGDTSLSQPRALTGGPAGPVRECVGCHAPLAYGNAMAACPQCHTINPAQIGPSAQPRAIGQSMEHVEDMIRRVLSGEPAVSVVESVIGELHE